jgi:acetyltransferase-like isoleucine patch superfamily enzyme
MTLVDYLFNIGVRGTIKTIYFNFRYLPFRQAKHIPILLSKKTFIKVEGGRVKIDCKEIKYAMIKFGINGEAAISDSKTRSSYVLQGALIFKGNADLGRGIRMIILPKGTLVFGKNFIITGKSSFRVYRNVTIGDDCLFSWDILIMDYDGHRIFDKDNAKINDSKPVIIGNHVWVGCRSTIWKGAIIPDNSVIGTGSLIAKELHQDSSIYVNIGQIRKENIRWEL